MSGLYKLSMQELYFTVAKGGKKRERGEQSATGQIIKQCIFSFCPVEV